jgi:hypothetical protein
MAQARSNSAGRGRGNSRHSVPSSRDASAASSTGPGNRLIMDPRHLQALQTHLDNLMRTIESRIEDVRTFTQLARLVDTDSSPAGRSH